MKITLGALACALLAVPSRANARLTAITITAVEPYAPGTSFGEAGADDPIDP